MAWEISQIKSGQGEATTFKHRRKAQIAISQAGGIEPCLKEHTLARYKAPLAR